MNMKVCYPYSSFSLPSVESDCTSLCATEEGDSKAAEQEEDVKPIEEKSPVKEPKHHSTHKSTAVAKEAAAAAKKNSGWATTFTLDVVQYVLKDAAGHPLCVPLFVLSLDSLIFPLPDHQE